MRRETSSVGYQGASQISHPYDGRKAGCYMFLQIVCQERCSEPPLTTAERTKRHNMTFSQNAHRNMITIPLREFTISIMMNCKCLIIVVVTHSTRHWPGYHLPGFRFRPGASFSGLPHYNLPLPYSIQSPNQIGHRSRTQHVHGNCRDNRQQVLFVVVEFVTTS